MHEKQSNLTFVVGLSSETIGYLFRPKTEGRVSAKGQCGWPLMGTSLAPPDTSRDFAASPLDGP